MDRQSDISVRAAPSRRKPFKLAYPDPTEDQYQESVANLLDAILKPEEAIYTHVPAGGYELGGSARGRLMRLGLHRGWPDICIAYSPGRMLWLEFKTALGRLSLDQRQRHAQLEALGHVVVVCRWRAQWAEDIIAILERHGVPYRQSSLDRSYRAPIYQDESVTTSGAAAEHAEGTGEAAYTPSRA